MPTFLAGESFAHTFAEALGLPVLRCSHQEGHLAAAEYFLAEKTKLSIVVHLSGGTSDVLVARRTIGGYAMKLLGEGTDLHAGQFVDRVGIAMGLPFPAGADLEKLAQHTNTLSKFRLPSHVKEACMSFSGPCSAALRAVSKGVSHTLVARAVEDCLANSLIKAIVFASTKVPQAENCIVVGGVSANIHIRDRLVRRLASQTPDLNVFFAPPGYASDNALGVATLAYRFFQSA
jgi:N6-L-threonylcarbamoyladenine synthase